MRVLRLKGIKTGSKDRAMEDTSTVSGRQRKKSSPPKNVTQKIVKKPVS